MATTTAAAPQQTFLQKLGGDFKKIFGWLGNPKVQQADQQMAKLCPEKAFLQHRVDPATGRRTLILTADQKTAFNAFGVALDSAQIFNLADHRSSAAAGTQNGTGTQKAAMSVLYRCRERSR